MSPPSIMTKALIQQRLMAMSPGRGRRSPKDTRLLVSDVSVFTGVHVRTLYKVADKTREVDDALQLQLSSFFALVDRGLIVKVVEGNGCVLRRLAPGAGMREPRRATIDLSGLVPRVNWSR